MVVRSYSVAHIGSAFLRRVLSRMRELGLNRTTLSARMQVSRPYVTKVVKGDVNISFATAAKFATALQMDFCPQLVPQEKKQSLCEGGILASSV